jgi:hypothetical protein
MQLLESAVSSGSGAASGICSFFRFTEQPEEIDGFRWCETREAEGGFFQLCSTEIWNLQFLQMLKQLLESAVSSGSEATSGICSFFKFWSNF